MPGAKTSDSSAAAAGGDQGWPVARARSQPCTWYSQRIMLSAMSPGMPLPPRRSGRLAAPPRIASVMVLAAARTSAAGSAGTWYPSVLARGAWPAGSAKPAAKMASQPSTCSRSWPTSYSVHGVGSCSWPSLTPPTTGASSASTSASRSVVFSVAVVMLMTLGGPARGRLEDSRQPARLS